MAENDGRARTSVSGVDTLLENDTPKDDPIDKTRLFEEDERAQFYATAGEKDTLPEHEARREQLAHIVGQ